MRRWFKSFGWNREDYFYDSSNEKHHQKKTPPNTHHRNNTTTTWIGDQLFHMNLLLWSAIALHHNRRIFWFQLAAATQISGPLKRSRELRHSEKIVPNRNEFFFIGTYKQSDITAYLGNDHCLTRAECGRTKNKQRLEDSCPSFEP